MNLKEQEEEVMEYLKKLFDGGRYVKFDDHEMILARLIVKAILARYELYDTEDIPRGE